MRNKSGKLRKMKNTSTFDIINFAILIIFALLCLYPFVYMLALSFNTGTDTMKGGVTFYPRDFTLANFASILRDGTILGAYKITILRTVIGTFTSVFVTALVAYGLSNKNLPGRKYIMLYMMIPMFFSGGIIPYYLTLGELHLIDTFAVYIIPGMFNIWNCIVMKTSFQQIPESLKEAMRIDGGGELKIFLKVVVPMSLPMFAAISLFTAVGHWNDWFTGAYYVRSNELIPVQTYLQQVMTRNMSSFLPTDGALVTGGNGLFDYSQVNSFSLKMAAVVIGTVPILIVYPFLQKYFTKGVLVGSIKE